ncbi:anti-sigma-D factor RsdA [Micromonospora sp. NPDC047670]|uniref:anti-sigma-D factor RsdA n=1 Tax=Micromonospora sp. NPDC047670 TaxID=3364252 RepID=UPI00370FE319
MSEHRPDGGEELDLATVARDDQLLDALGRGEPGPADDDLAAMLSAWRSDIDADSHGSADLPRVAAEPGRPVGPAADLPPVSTAARSAPLGRRVLRLAAAVIAVSAIVAGLGVGSRNAGPTSALWSLTRVLYPQQADVRLVEDTIRRARSAATAGRFDEARGLVDQARRELASVDDPAALDRLDAEVDALHRELLDAVPTPGAPSAGASTPPGGNGTPTPTRPSPSRSAPPPAPGHSTTPHVVVPLPGPPRPHPNADSKPPTLTPSLPGLPVATGGILD